MSDLFKLLNNTLQNKHKGVVEDGVVGDYAGYISTGSYWLNAVLSGSIYNGFPSNKIMILQGVSSTGKSYFALSMIANYLNEYPDAKVCFLETEGAISKSLFVERGIDPKRVFVVSISTVQEFRSTTAQILDAYDKQPEKHPLLIVVDSLGMLSTDKEQADALSNGDKKDMTRASLLRSAFRVISLRLAEHNVPMICTNHTYAQVGAYVPTNIGSGGGGAVYSASTIIDLSKSQDKEGTARVGNIIKAKVTKSRFTREGIVASCKLSYTKGLDKYFGLVDLAIDAGIWKSTGTRVEMEDGSKVFAKVIYADPEKYFTDDVMKRIDAHVGSIYKFGLGESEVEEDVDSE